MSDREPKTPRVFVSHAGEDKERFVLDFATKLRTNGIDAWLDQWEMLPGDSLVDKIFEEGIKNADAFIVVLSKFSVNKPWVREELNAQLIRKIEDNSRLIPVLIDDDCEPAIPTVLRSTIWQTVKDLSDYDADLDRIVRAIYGHPHKPPLGTAPAYTSTVVDTPPGLTLEDSIVLKLSCEEALGNDRNQIIVRELVHRAQDFDISKAHCMEILEILDAHQYIDIQQIMGPERFYFYSVTTFGLQDYAKVYLPDYEETIAAVALRILNHNERWDHEIATAIGKPVVLVDHVLDHFDQRGLIKFTDTSGGRAVWEVSAELKRALQNA